ncbi:hypothetical protein SAMN05443377_11068 [Propionibacterium cyclohexanicum]|uniref:HAD family hydrolase n=1 Tax=Propionibacterium cyclohexanicum TaxID=64702 RepID=A0A1H9RZN2_9ACTN|nr:Cof-type HAD-IIB family hydrolase [Propionibacterium cyclohexanicum]SER78144.1 hypothetical protein SAMN05443377_11068 [Propionibacterium cyclohexanicum]
MSQPNDTATAGPQDPEQAVPADADVRLVVADLDGTLLDADSRIPPALWPLLDRMRAHGIVFVPASGRQYATLRAMFERFAHTMPFIAENGGYVVRDGHEIDSTTLEPDVVAAVVARVRELVRHGADLGIVVCGKNSAYVERHDEAFMAQARIYYVALAEVDDVVTADDEIVKLAIYDFGHPERTTMPHLAEFEGSHRVVLSGKHWVDVMPAGVNKGLAVASLQRELGIGREQTAAFGDYLNDVEMLDAADLSFAVANAHPQVKSHARAVIAANTDGGVIAILTRLLEVREQRREAVRPAQP